MGVHLAGILLAGVGLAWLVRAAYDAARPGAPTPRSQPARRSSPCRVVLAPAWTERAHYDERGADYIRGAADSTTRPTDGTSTGCVAIVKPAATAGSTPGCAPTGARVRVGFVPVHAWLADRDVDAIGFTFRTIPSLSNDIEARFDETNPAQYQMFNVRYLILPSDRKPRGARDARRAERAATGSTR